MQNNNVSTIVIDNSTHFRELILTYLKNWKWFLLSAMLCLIIAKLYLRYSIPQYRAAATILVKEEGNGGPSELTALEDLGLFKGSQKDIDDEIEILKSRSLIEKVVKDKEFNIVYRIEGRIKTLDAYTYNPIEINFLEKDEKFYNTDTTLVVKIISAKKYILYNQDNNEVGKYDFGKKIKTKLGDAIIYYTNHDNISIENNVSIKISDLNSTSNYFKNKLAVMTISKFTNVIEISITDPVKEKAEDFINKLIEFYNNDAIADKNLVSKKTSDFIADRLGIITKELDGVEREVEKYKKDNKITDLTSEAGLYLDNASDYNKNSIETRTQLKVVDLMIDYMKNNKSDDLIPANIVPDEGTSSSLIAEYNNLVVERNRILKSATPENPILIRVNDKIESLKHSVEQSLLRLKSSLLVKRNDIEKQGSVLNNKISQIPRQEREYRGIFRQQNIKEELYLYLFKKREETAISLAVTAPNAKIVDSAIANESPVSPNRMLVYLIALLLGVLIPFVIIYLLDLLDTKVKNKQDIDANLTIPFIGDVPHSDDNNEIIQSSSRTSSAEAIRIVRTNLEFVLSNLEISNKAKTIFLTSTLPKEGKTFIAINLAATIAISGKKVLLIGMDIRNPKLDEYVKLPSRGLTNFLSTKDASISDFIVKQKGYERFDILPAGIIPPNPAELLMSKKVESMFELLKSEYDYIVVDTAPVSLVTDTLLISKNADTFVYVVRANYLDKAFLRTPESLYKEGKLPNMCVLLNDTDTKNGYGYGYGQEEVKTPWYKKFFSFSILG
jgi:capsular exopolysaccharide synthesis family protein